jgi:hypothetical protein
MRELVVSTMLSSKVSNLTIQKTPEGHFVFYFIFGVLFITECSIVWRWPQGLGPLRKNLRLPSKWEPNPPPPPPSKQTKT